MGATALKGTWRIPCNHCNRCGRDEHICTEQTHRPRFVHCVIVSHVARGFNNWVLDELTDSLDLEAKSPTSPSPVEKFNPVNLECLEDILGPVFLVSPAQLFHFSVNLKASENLDLPAREFAQPRTSNPATGAKFKSTFNPQRVANSDRSAKHIFLGQSIQSLNPAGAQRSRPRLYQVPTEQPQARAATTPHHPL